MRKIFAALCLLCLHAIVYAAPLQSEAEVRQLTDKAMALAGQGDINSMYGLLTPYVVVENQQIEAARNTATSHRQQMAQTFGSSVGYEFVRMEKAGGSLLKLAYIEKTEKQALPWYFIYYKTASGWVLSTFGQNDNPDSLFSH